MLNEKLWLTSLFLFFILFVQMKFSCFSSSDQRAVNATQLYNDNSAEGSLWMRGRQDIPLPRCSHPISPPPDTRCLVCVEQKVYAVCRNLTETVKMVMEADGDNVVISESSKKPDSFIPVRNVLVSIQY